MLDANDNGTKLANYTTPSGSWSSPTIANGRLYIGNHDWNVYCFANTITAATNSSAGNNLSSPSSLVVIALITAIIALAAVTLFYFGRKIRLNFEVNAEANAEINTPAKQNASEKATVQGNAEAAIMNDSFVQALMNDFGATIIPNSIKPV